MSNCLVVDKQLIPISDSFFYDRSSGPGVFKNLVVNTYLGCCMAFRRDLVEKALPFPKSIAMHDWWLGLVADCVDSVGFIEEPLVLYRRHESNVSDTAKKSTSSFFLKIKWRINMLFSLILRCAR